MKHNPDSPAETLREAADRELRRPLAALRAALEALARSVEPTEAGADMLTRALLELERVDRTAETLADYIVPPPLRPISCSVREVASAARATLPEALRGRVLLAQEPRQGRLVVDGTALARDLRLLLEDALVGADGDVLLHAHQDDEVAYFAIVEPNPPRTERAQSLEELVARRGLERLGASVATRRSAGGHRCRVVRVATAGDPSVGEERAR